MKFFWWLSLVLCGLSSASQGVFSSANSCDCVVTPFFQYKKGMRFFFPKDSLQEAMKTEMEGYNKFGLKTNVPADRILYNQVAGKTFEIQEIDSIPDLVSGISHSYPVIVLKEPGGFTMSYVGSFEAMAVSQKEYNNGENQTNSLPMTVCVDDLLACKNDPGNCYQPGKQYYFKLPVADKGADPLKFQHIEIVGIDKGTWANPVRVSYRLVGSAEVHTVDVGAATRGLPDAKQDHNLFHDFFLAPPDFRTMVDSFGGDTSLWKAFREGKIQPKMKKIALDLAYGRPDDLVTKLSEEGQQEKGTYGKQKVRMLNGIVKTVIVTSN